MFVVTVDLSRQRTENTRSLGPDQKMAADEDTYGRLRQHPAGAAEHEAGDNGPRGRVADG
jgi:hypothetical protein